MSLPLTLDDRKDKKREANKKSILATAISVGPKTRINPSLIKTTDFSKSETL